MQRSSVFICKFPSPRAPSYRAGALFVLTPSADEIDAMSFRDLIRSGAERGLIDDPAAWFAFREDRNISSHTYDESKAKEVYRAALAFAPIARELLSRLESRGP